MKDKLDIGKYIAKAKLQELSKAEKQQLDEWLEADEKNKKLYSKLTNDDNIEQNLLKMQQVNVEKELRKVNSKIDKKRSKIRYMNILRVAATLVVPIVGYFLLQYYTPQEVVEPLTQITPGSWKAILITAEGKELELETEANATLNIGSEVVVENKFNKLVYKTEFPNLKKRKEEVFNTLRTPLQGEYALTLEDGTNVWLNSGSSLRYPTQFVKDKRMVYLVGEGYFEIAKNAEQPFIVVLSEGTEVKALGTEFNIKAYTDDVTHETTLVEGSVEVAVENLSQEKEYVVLKPNEQLKQYINSEKFEVLEVDASIYASWRTGVFMFEHEKLVDLVKTLERWYGFKTTFTDEEAKDIVFTGEVKKYEDFGKVLEMLQFTEDVIIEVEQNEVIIKTNM